MGKLPGSPAPEDPARDDPGVGPGAEGGWQAMDSDR